MRMGRLISLSQGKPSAEIIANIEVKLKEIPPELRDEAAQKQLGRRSSGTPKYSAASKQSRPAMLRNQTQLNKQRS